MWSLMELFCLDQIETLSRSCASCPFDMPLMASNHCGTYCTVQEFKTILRLFQLSDCKINTKLQPSIILSLFKQY